MEDAEVRSFLAGLPDACFASHLFSQEHRAPLIQPRGGFATFTKQKGLTSALHHAGTDFLPLTIDSYTRHNDYERAQILLEQSEEQDKDLLNGYPLVNYGFEVTRSLYKGIDKPVCLRHGTPDARVLAEMALASGITEIEGGGLCYCLPYSTDFPLDKAILYWQYVDRLCASYSRPERPIHRELFGPLTATMVPPSIVVAVSVVELLLAAEQGIESISVGMPQSGSFLQDLATATVLRNQCRRWLDAFGFEAVRVKLVYHQWMGPFPREKELADHLIAASAMISRLVGADKVVIKTREEAHGVPSVEANVRAIREVRFVFDKTPYAGKIHNELSELEEEIIQNQAEAVIMAILDLPGSSFWYSVFEAVREGIIDIPYSPNLINANKLLTVRDGNGSIRIVSAGNVPIPGRELRKENEMLQRFPSMSTSLADQMLSDIFMMQ